MIKVVNKYSHEPTEHDFYIGRGSPLGNPYSSKESSKEWVKRVETREEAVSKFRSWIEEEIKNENEDIISELFDILVHEKERGKVFLVCFCKPKLCHGDVVRDILIKIKEENDRF